MDTSESDESYRRRWVILAVLCLSVLLTVVANMSLNVALPTSAGSCMQAPPPSSG
jgi:hypothetical protein